MPLISNRTVHINGNRYVDGFMDTNNSIKKARDEGADVIILIDNSSKIKSKTEFLFVRIYALLTPGHMRDILRNYLYNDIKNNVVVEDEDIIYIRPKRELYANMFNNSRKRLKKKYQMGYSDMVSSEKLKSLFL